MSRGSQHTKELLLAAAREEFATHGVAGARVDRIAERAGVNKERIYGYFGNKDKLFDAVVTDALDELADAIPLSAEDDPAEYVGRVYDFHSNNPTLLRLLLWEGLHYREQALPCEADRAVRYREKVTALAKTLKVDPSREVGACLLTLIGLAAWPNAVQQLTRLLVGVSTETEAFRQTMRAHVVEFARRALSNTASGTHMSSGVSHAGFAADGNSSGQQCRSAPLTHRTAELLVAKGADQNTVMG
jgi:AcrR family transcriptional regulator